MCQHQLFCNTIIAQSLHNGKGWQTRLSPINSHRAWGRIQCCYELDTLPNAHVVLASMVITVCQAVLVASGLLASTKMNRCTQGHTHIHTHTQHRHTQVTFQTHITLQTLTCINMTHTTGKAGTLRCTTYSVVACGYYLELSSPLFLRHLLLLSYNLLYNQFRTPQSEVLHHLVKRGLLRRCWRGQVSS